MQSLLDILNKTKDYFHRKNVPNARLDAEYLLAHVLKLKRMELYLNFEKPMTETELSVLRPLVKRRASREPLQHILGKAAFMDFELGVDSRALIPRPETEELIELITRECINPPSRILDLGTGTGAIACALARRYPDAQICATDVDRATLDLARENLQMLDLSEQVNLVTSDWFSDLNGRFDLIVSNPPYLAEKELAELEPEVKDFEPVGALVSGPSGIEAILKIITEAKTFLVEGGSCFLETGANQYQAVRSAISEEVTITPFDDLAGKQRFLKISYLP